MSHPSPNEPSLTGGCGCGAVRWRLTEPPASAGYCHCGRCQHRTGTAAGASAAIVPGSFEVTRGEDLIKAWRPVDGMEKHFCGECGSALFSRDPDDRDRMGVRMGSFDGDPGVRPAWHQFVDFAAPWEPLHEDGLPRYGEGRPL
ncbi:MAG: GFA family protein [Solirubrobacterales bacterium]